MSVPENIKEEISTLIVNGEIDVESILTTLVECEVIDNAFDLYDDVGEFDEEADKRAQAAVTMEIIKQLKRAGH